MSTPARRQPVRVARGPFTALLQSVGDLLDGEMCYAEDQRALYVAEERGGRMELNAVRTTLQPSAPPPLSFNGLADITQPPQGSLATPAPGDVVVVRATAVPDPGWTILPAPAGNLAAGTQLVWDGASQAWIDLGPTVQLPDWFTDFDQLPPLP